MSLISSVVEKEDAEEEEAEEEEEEEEDGDPLTVGQNDYGIR